VEQVGPNQVVVSGSLGPAALDRLYGLVVDLLLAQPRRTVVCALQGPMDLAVLDVLARLQLTAKRLGVCVSVTGGEALVRLAGLSEALGQPEPREQGGVEEVVDVDDLTG
jgi:hypothetical protein